MSVQAISLRGRAAHVMTQDASNLVSGQQVFERLTAAVVAAVLLIAPWTTGIVAPGMMAITVLGILVALGRRSLPRSPLIALCALVPLGQTISLLVSPDLTWALRLVVLSWAGLGCVVAIAQMDDEGKNIVMTGMALSAAVVCTVALSGAGDMSSHEGGGVITGRLQGPFAQPNELGAFSQLSLPILVALAASARDRRVRILGFVAALPVAGTLIMSLSRGAWLGTIVSFTLLALLAPRLRRPLAIVGLVLGAIVALSLVIGGPIAAIVGDRLKSIFDSSESVTDQRPAIWDFALGLISRNPVFGTGPGGMSVSSLDPETSRVAFVQPLHAHNLFLTTLAEGGLMGALTLAALIVLGVLIAVRLRRRLRGEAEMGDVWMPLGITAALAGAVAHGVIDFPWRAPALTFLTWALVGGLARYTVNERPIMTDTTNNRPWPESNDVGNGTFAQTSSDGHGARHLAPSAEDDAMDTSRGGRHVSEGGDDSGSHTQHRRVLNLPAALAVLGTLLVGIFVLLMPQTYSSTSVLGLRPSEGTIAERNAQQQVPMSQITIDDLKQLATQYAVTAGDTETVEKMRDAAKLPKSSSATASVDPESTTLRITAKAPTREAAATLAQRLTDNTVKSVDKDNLANVAVLQRATPQFADSKPNKPLYAGVGEAVVLALCAGLWLLRRRA